MATLIAMAPLIRLSLFSYGFLAILYTPSSALQRAQLAPQLNSRQDFVGGWPLALSGATCPAGLVTCESSISNPACCPTGTDCLGLGEQYCCPANTSCKAVLDNFPQCADSKWTLYVLSASGTPAYFCCPDGQVGVLPLSGYGGFCQPEGTSVEESRIAVKASDFKTAFEATRYSTITLTSVTTESGQVSTILDVSTARITYTTTKPVFGPSGILSGGDSGNNDNTASQSTSKTASPNSPASSTPTPGSSSSSLGGGAIAGIVIGALGVIALFLVAFLLYRRRRPHSTPAYTAPPHQEEVKDPTDGSVPPHAGVVEAPGQYSWEQRAEMGTGR